MRLCAVVVIVLACGQTTALAQTTPPPSPPPFYLDFTALPEPTAAVLTTTNDPSLFGNRDRLWEFRTGGARHLGKGLVVSADVAGGRASRLPLYDWIVRLRIEKTFVRRKWELRLVGGLMAPLGSSDRTMMSPSAGVFASRAVWAGIVLAF